MLAITMNTADIIAVEVQAYGYEWTEKGNWHLLASYWEAPKGKLAKFIQCKSASAIMAELGA